MRYNFPYGFLWGAATSSHQVEGNTTNDWSEWEEENAERLAKEAKSKFGHLPNWPRVEPEASNPANYISGTACDQFNRYREDFALARSLGHSATRFSLEWSRIEPEKGRFDETALAHYRDVVASARALGLEPFVTLWHWTIPLWLRDEGGVLSRDFPILFERFAKKAAESIDGIDFYITLNEPEIFSLNSYLKGGWPPQKRSIFAQTRAMNALAKAHRLAYAAIKSVRPAANIGIAKNNIHFDAPASSLAKRAADWWWNFRFLDKIADRQDFIGLNHYFHNRIAGGFNKNENRELSDLGWELYPESIYHVLSDLKKYKKPIYITENGLADAADEKRTWFIAESLKHVHRAMAEGALVRGYLHWSLLDNFEWDKGFWPRFGLIEVDYRTLERKPRPSAYVYKQIIEDNGFDA